MIVETDASELGYGEILKQRIENSKKNQLDITLELGQDHKRIIPQLKKKFYPQYSAYQIFKTIYITKDFYLEQIANQQKRFCKKM